MDYREAKQHLYSDGSLRDVYVLDTTADELNSFLNYVQPMIKRGNFVAAEEIADLPNTYTEIIDRWRDWSKTVSIPVGSGVVNCHFFDDSELELDFSPNDYCNETDWIRLDAFLQGLANAMRREVLVTAENSQDLIYIKYQPGGEQADAHQPTPCREFDASH